MTGEIQNKPWYASRGVWGGIITVLAGAAGAIWGFEISPATQEAAVSGIIGVVTAVGGLVAVYGRVKAETKIGK